MGEYYKLCKVFDVILMTDSFKHFRDNTLESFRLDPMCYITAPQVVYFLFLQITVREHKKVTDKWALYEIQIDVNEDLSEKLPMIRV